MPLDAALLQPRASLGFGPIWEHDARITQEAGADVIAV